MKTIKITGFIPALLLTLCLGAPAFSIAGGSGLSGSITGGGAGIGLNQNQSYKFGEYTGITQDGFGVGDFDIRYDGDDNFYVNFLGENLGWESREITLETGWSGGPEFYANYDGTPHRISDNSQTIYNGVGSGNLTLPTGFVTGADTTDAGLAASLSAFKRGVNTYTDRRSGKAGFSIPFWGVFNLDISYKREEKDGVLSLGQCIGEGGGGTTRAIVLPRPVDFSNDEVNFSLSYAGEAAQLILTYYYSRFENNDGTLAWQSPFVGSGALAGEFPTTGLASLEPSNDYHRIGLSGGMDLPFWSSRVNVLGQYGIMDQDQTLLPYSNNPATVINTPLPRNTAQARIETAHAAVNLTARPMKDVNLSAKYKFYSTDNSTPRALWLKAENDLSATQGAASSGTALYNQPYDYTQNRADLVLSYNLFSHTTIKAGYIFEHMDRDYREAQKTTEHTGFIGVRSHFSDYIHAALNYSHSRRTYNDYDQAYQFNNYHSPGYLATITQPLGPPTVLTNTSTWGNHPYLRKFDLANRDQDKFNGSVTFIPDETITVGLYGGYGADDYDNSFFGLQHSDNASFTADINYSPVENANFFAYFTREDIESTQAGRDFQGNAKATQSVDPNRNWWAYHDDTVHTLGLGTSFSFLDDRLSFRGDYSFSQSTSEITFANNGYEQADDMDDMQTNLHSLNLTCDYKVNSHWGVGFGYLFEHYTSDDWQVDTYSPASSNINDIILMSGSSPDYDAHVGMMTVTYYFSEKD